MHQRPVLVHPENSGDRVTAVRANVYTRYANPATGDPGDTIALVGIYVRKIELNSAWKYNRVPATWELAPARYIDLNVGWDRLMAQLKGT